MSQPIKIEWTVFKLQIVVDIFSAVELPSKFGSIEETVYASIFYGLEQKLQKKYLSHRKQKKPFKITLEYHETAVLSNYLMKYGNMCPAEKRIVLAHHIQTIQQTIQY